MSFYVGIQLMYLLENNKHEAKGMSTDWGSEINEFKSLMSNILVLLATPGILKRLHKGYRESAAYKIEKLIDFFTLIDEGNTLVWMDYLKTTHTSSPEQILDQKIKYYTFKNSDTNESNFFSFNYSIHKKRYEKMREIFASLNSRELLSGK